MNHQDATPSPRPRMNDRYEPSEFMVNVFRAFVVAATVAVFAGASIDGAEDLNGKLADAKTAVESAQAGGQAATGR